MTRVPRRGPGSGVATSTTSLFPSSRKSALPPSTISRKSASVFPYAVGWLSAGGRVSEGITRPAVESRITSVAGWGGLTSAEERKKDEFSEGREDTEFGLSGGEGRALECGDEGWLEDGNSMCMVVPRMVW